MAPFISRSVWGPSRWVESPFIFLPLNAGHSSHLVKKGLPAWEVVFFNKSGRMIWGLLELQVLFAPGIYMSDT